MMEAQISKKKLERLSITGGDFRKAGRRSRGEMTTEGLRRLLADDVKDIQRRHGGEEGGRVILRRRSWGGFWIGRGCLRRAG